MWEKRSWSVSITHFATTLHFNTERALDASVHTLCVFMVCVCLLKENPNRGIIMQLDDVSLSEKDEYSLFLKLQLRICLISAIRIEIQWLNQ